MAREKLTKRQLDFLRVWYPRLRIGPLTVKFNARFGTDKSECAVKSTCSNHKIRCGRPTGNRKGDFRSFTKEQARFLERKYKKLSIPELTTAFNEEFSENKRWQQIRAFVHNQGFQSGRTGYFPKGSTPWNKGLKGYMGPNRTSFKKGHKPKNLKPLGYKRVDSKDGYILVKVDEKNPYTNYQGRFRPKHVVIWEKVNGRKVPPGHAVIFADGNRRNFRPKNLVLVSRAELARLNQKNYSLAPKELKPSILALAKLVTKAHAMARAL